MRITFSIEQKTLDLITMVEEQFFGTITKEFPKAIEKICQKLLNLNELNDKILDSYAQSLTKISLLIKIHYPEITKHEPGILQELLAEFQELEKEMKNK